LQLLTAYLVFDIVKEKVDHWKKPLNALFLIHHILTLSIVLLVYSNWLPYEWYGKIFHWVFLESSNVVFSIYHLLQRPPWIKIIFFPLFIVFRIGWGSILFACIYYDLNWVSFFLLFGFLSIQYIWGVLMILHSCCGFRKHADSAKDGNPNTSINQKFK